MASRAERGRKAGGAPRLSPGGRFGGEEGVVRPGPDPQGKRRLTTCGRMARRGLAGLLAAMLTAAAAFGEPTEDAAAAALQAAVRQVETGDLAGAVEALSRLDSAGVPAPLQGQVSFLRGVLALRQGRLPEAAERLEQAAAALPLLADYALFWLAAARRQAGEFAPAAATLQRLLEEHPESLFVERAARALLRSWFEAGELALAEAAVGRYLAGAPTGPGRAEAWFTLGEIFQRTDRPGPAEEVLRRIWIELPASPESRRAREALAAMPGARPFTPDERFRRAMTLHRQGHHQQALGELAPFAEPGSREASARLALGISAFQVRQYEQAARWLEPLADRTAAPDRGEALFWLARSLGRSGDAAGFGTRMERLAELATPPRRAEEALFLLGRAAMDDADPRQALDVLGRLLRQYPKGAWRDQGLWLMGWAHYKLGDLPASVAAWERLLKEEAGSRLRPQGAYWRARALEALSRERDAVQAYRALLKEFPDQAYYRMRAVDRLARLGKPAPVARPAAAPVAFPTEGGGVHLLKARALRELGLGDEAVDEYGEHLRSRPEERAALAESCQAFLALGRYDRAVWLGRRLLAPLFIQAAGVPPIQDYWGCVYPRGYWELVRRHAAPHDLDPHLVTALIREESAFLPSAVSRAGARGLMQLMPQTAGQVARTAGLTAAEAGRLENPEANIRLGTVYFAGLVREYGGRISLALAAYNAGTQPVQRWLQRFGWQDEEEFLEDIPYTETRNYVKRVLGSYERYTGLYGAPSREPNAEGR